jgi:GNAT superfamily N-acetyltransferase
MDCCPVSIRPATETDAPVVLQFLRHMLQELASMGDPPLSGNEEGWAHLQHETTTGIQEPGQCHLLAETVGPAPAAVGWAYARIEDREPIYEPERLLHISALFVSSPYRKKGIGRTLLEALLEWGRDSGCVEVELNVLVDNPARALYEKLGFHAARVKMIRKL